MNNKVIASRNGSNRTVMERNVGTDDRIDVRIIHIAVKRTISTDLLLKIE